MEGVWTPQTPLWLRHWVLNTYYANARPVRALAFLLYQLFYHTMHVVCLSVCLSVRDVGGLSRAVIGANVVSVLYGPFEMIRIYHYCGFVFTTVFDFSHFFARKQNMLIIDFRCLDLGLASAPDCLASVSVSPCLGLSCCCLASAFASEIPPRSLPLPLPRKNALTTTLANSDLTKETSNFSTSL